METVAHKDMNRTVTFILTMLLTVHITSVCADSEDWDLVVEINSIKSYIDYDRIWELDGYVNYWQLNNRNEPTESLGSTMVLNKGHCLMRTIQSLHVSFYKSRWAKNLTYTDEESSHQHYARPHTRDEIMLNKACENINK